MTRTRIGTSIHRAVGSLLVLLLSTPSGDAPVVAAQAPAAASSGQSATLLPDGSRLLIGGDAARHSVAVVHPASGAVQTLAVSPVVPRSWHTATLLADGTVLLVGGVDTEGRLISTPERFHPATRTFELLPADGFAARARHSATLLTDGRVLIAGGQTAAVEADVELWNPESQTAIVLPSSMHEPRAGHRATLLGDGRVLVEGGAGRSSAHPGDEIFDPGSNLFIPQSTRPQQPDAVFVTAVMPLDGARDVALTQRIGLRFSQPLWSASLSRQSVRLAGPDGAVELLVIPAEGGRLAFAWPLEPLTPDTTYHLSIEGAVTSDSRPLPRFVAVFTTAADAVDVVQAPHDSEAWDPRGRGRRSWTTDAPPSPWQMLPALQAGPGITALAGQALTLTGHPLADVSLTIGDQTTRTDKTGRFLLALPGGIAGRRQLEIEGATASRPGRTYGFFEVAVTLAPGQTTALPYTIWMPAIDTAHAVRIASPTTRDMVITTPKIPGLELHLPRGTIVKDRTGRVVREISITPIPVDRPPFPLPSHIDVPVYFTIQPGGAYVYSATYQSRKARLIYPNYHDVPKDVIASFWHYDPAELDWYVYGAGKVTGTQIVPDPGVGLYEFTGAMLDVTNPPPADAPVPGGGPRKGDPVDVGTGLFVLDKVDLFLPDVLPLTLTRTYRPKDPVSRQFGIGSTHPYMMRLWSAQNYQQADLILPDGGRVHYVRISAGTGFMNAVYEHTTTPTAFYKSRIAWNGDGWDLTLRDGTVYVFGDVAPLQAIRDRFGNTITIEHANGQQGNVTRVVSPNGRWITFSYDGANRITQAQDNIGRTVGYQYDANGRLWKVTDPAGGVTEYTYDSFHRMLTIKDPRNIVFLTNTYDSNGRVTNQTLADGSTWQFAYTLDGNGRVTQADVTDPRGHVARSTFNSAGYELTATEAVGLPEERTTTYTRATGSNLVTAILDPLGRETQYGYDANGKLTSVTRLAGTSDAVTTGFTYTTTYDQLASVTDPLNQTTAFGYDTLGRLATVTDPLGHETTFTYNVAGQPLTAANHLQETIAFGYDRGDLVSITDALAQTTTRYLDAAGRLLRLTDPLGRGVTYAYSPLNQITAITNALGGETTFTYDANGNLLTLTDARGKTTTWTYDVMDRVATRTDPLSRAEAFTYDLNGNLTVWTDRKGQVTTYGYDALDRQVFVGFGTTAGPTYASTIATTYDAGDRATTIVDSAAGTITRTYDLLDRLTEEVTPEGTVAYTYDGAGRRISMTVAGQDPVAYTYDAADRLTEVAHGTATVTVTYDAVNRRTSLTLPNGIVVAYGYDAASRLTGLTYSDGSTTLGDLTYTYDANGQRTSVGGSWARTGLPAALASATYDDANQIATFGGTSFTYDANGNLTDDGVRSYTWDARNQLASLSGPVNGSFAYDGFGRRRSKTIGGTTTQFLYDGLNPVQELSGGSPVANLLTGLGIDEYLTRTDASGVRNFLTDALGSSVALADGSGTIQTEYSYEPFGGTSVSGMSTGSAFGFTGREGDGTGLYYYRARYYDPRLQRFVAEDPLGFGAGDSNLHAYAFNGPTQWRDPDGRCVPCAGALQGGAVAGVPGAIVGGIIGAVGGLVIADIIRTLFNQPIRLPVTSFPDPLNPPSHWTPRAPDVWFDPETSEYWHWHADPSGVHGGDHWDIGGPRPPGGGKGPQDWWPKGGNRGPKPPGGQRGPMLLPSGGERDPQASPPLGSRK